MKSEFDTEDAKSKLTPLCLDFFDRLKKQLPPEIGERLRCHRKVGNHGSYRTFLMFNIWDVNQTDILTPQHCCYGLRYDPEGVKQDVTPWHFLLWINKIRIYQNEDEIRRTLDRKLGLATPKPFKFSSGERAVSAKWNFNFERSWNSLPDFLLPNAVKLFSSMHPILMPIIDSFTSPMSKEERREVILGRTKQYFGPKFRRDSKTIREYTRSIPPSWRLEILERYGFMCVHCKTDLRGNEVHIDHITPFSKGGKTVKENLQPLCGPCNLVKGNRLNY